MRKGDGGMRRDDRRMRSLPAPGQQVPLPSEVWILLPAAQLLVAFLVALPFTNGFDRLHAHQRGVWIAALICAINSALLLAIPVMERRVGPRRGARLRAGGYAPRMVAAGRIALGLAVTLTAEAVANALGGIGVGVPAVVVASFLLLSFGTGGPPRDGDAADEDNRWYP